MLVCTSVVAPPVVFVSVVLVLCSAVVAPFDFSDLIVLICISVVEPPDVVGCTVLDTSVVSVDRKKITWLQELLQAGVCS